MLNKLKSLKNRYEELSALLAQPETMNDQKRYRELAREHAQLSEIVAAYDRYTAPCRSLRIAVPCFPSSTTQRCAS